MKRSDIGFLFDLDGVLIDTEGIYTDIWGEIDRCFPTGYPDFTERIKGTNLNSILTNYFPDLEIRAKALAMLNGFEDTMEYRPFDGAERFVRQAIARGIPCAVVTSSDKEKMRKLYRQQPWIRDLFDFTVTGDMVTRSKPDPECFLRGAAAIGVKPERCYVFEDSALGISAGLRSGAKVVALATTMPRELIDKNVGMVVDTIADIDINLLL